MYIVLIRWHVVSGNQDLFRRAVERLRLAELEERDGCVSFELSEVDSRPGHFLTMIVFEDKGAYAAHEASDIYEAFSAETRSWLIHKKVESYSLNPGKT